MTMAKGGETWRQDPKYSSVSPYSYQEAMEMPRFSVDSDSSTPLMMPHDQESDISVEDVSTQYHMSGDELWDTFWTPSDREWNMKLIESNHYPAANTASQLPQSNLSSFTYEVQTQPQSPEMETPTPMVPTSRPRTPYRQSTPKPSRPTTYSLFPRPLEVPAKPSLPPRSTSLTQVTPPSRASRSQTALPPVHSLPSMSTRVNVSSHASFASIGAVLEAPMPTTPHLASSPFRQSRAPPTTPSSADSRTSPFRQSRAPPTTPSSADSRTSKLVSFDHMDVPWTPTREKRWAGTYRPFTSTAQLPVLRERSASTTAYPVIVGSGPEVSYQAPKTPMRPRTQNSALSRPTGDIGPSSFYSTRLHSSSSRPNLRPTTSHQNWSSSATYLSTLTPPPTPSATSASLSPRTSTGDNATEAVMPAPNMKSVFDLDSDDEGDNGSTTRSMLKRFVLRPFTSKPPSASANSISPHKRSASDGKKSLSIGKRKEAANEHHRRARGTTEGAAGPFLRDGSISSATGLMVEVGEEKETDRPRLKRKESFAQFLGWGQRH